MVPPLTAPLARSAPPLRSPPSRVQAAKEEAEAEAVVRRGTLRRARTSARAAARLTDQECDAHRRRAMEAFRRADRDDDGFLSLDEFCGAQGGIHGGVHAAGAGGGGGAVCARCNEMFRAYAAGESMPRSEFIEWYLEGPAIAAVCPGPGVFVPAVPAVRVGEGAETEGAVGVVVVLGLRCSGLTACDVARLRWNTSRRGPMLAPPSCDPYVTGGRPAGGMLWRTRRLRDTLDPVFDPVRLMLTVPGLATVPDGEAATAAALAAVRMELRVYDWDRHKWHDLIGTVNGDVSLADCLRDAREGGEGFELRGQRRWGGMPIPGAPETVTGRLHVALCEVVQFVRVA
jgi:hypothetical protein